MLVLRPRGPYKGFILQRPYCTQIAPPGCNKSCPAIGKDVPDKPYEALKGLYKAFNLKCPSLRSRIALRYVPELRNRAI